MVRKIILLATVMVILAMNATAQEVVKLWKESAPTANELTGSEKWEKGGGWVSNVSTAELHIYKASKNSDGKAVIICPGGGYGGLAFGHEGTDVATWLNGRGITAVILKYRMPNKHSQVPLEDGQQAMRYVRENAESLGVNPNRIGILGFSAGGHLASTISTHYANEGTSTRPDFSILFYPVITMSKVTHGGSRTNLLGDKPSEFDIRRFSNEKQVTVNTPPTILLLSDDDLSVSPQNSTAYYKALNSNNIPATMYIFPKGGHGWGFKKEFSYHEEMKTLLGKWLDDLKL